MVLLYEGGVSPVQLRVLLILWANSLIKACSVEANPVETLLVLCVASGPIFDLIDNHMRVNTKKREQQQKQTMEIELSTNQNFELPVSQTSTFQKNQIKLKTTHYVPSLWTSLLSVAFMTYLLTRRHQLTPDLLHFTTCLQEDLQHMLWLFVLWVCFRQPYCKQDAIMASVELILAHLVAGSLAGAVL